MTGTRRFTTTIRRWKWFQLVSGPWRDAACALGLQVIMSVALATGGPAAASAASVAAGGVFMALGTRSVLIRLAVPALNLVGAVVAFGNGGAFGAATMGAIGLGSWLVSQFISRSELSRRGRHVDATAREAERHSIGLVAALTAAFAVLIAVLSNLAAPALALPAALAAAGAGLVAMNRSLAVSTMGGNEEEFAIGAVLDGDRVPHLTDGVEELDVESVTHARQIVTPNLFEDEAVELDD